MTPRFRLIALAVLGILSGGGAIASWMVIAGGEEVRRLDAQAQQTVVVDAKLCDRGNPAACNNLAVALEAGELVAQNLPEAARIYEKMCGQGQDIACVNFAGMLLDGRGIAQDSARAAGLFSDACGRNSDEACFRMAECLYAGIGVPRDLNRAQTLFSRACDAGLITSCTRLGEIQLGNFDDLVERWNSGDAERARIQGAVALLERACEASEWQACRAMVKLKDQSQLPFHDPHNADLLLMRLCNVADGPACFELANRWTASGIPTVPDVSVDALRRRACDAGVAAACSPQ